MGHCNDRGGRLWKLFDEKRPEKKRVTLDMGAVLAGGTLKPAKPTPKQKKNFCLGRGESPAGQDCQGQLTKGENTSWDVSFEKRRKRLNEY